MENDEHVMIILVNCADFANGFMEKCIVFSFAVQFEAILWNSLDENKMSFDGDQTRKKIKQS